LFAALTGRWATVPLGFDSHALSYPLNLLASEIADRIVHNHDALVKGSTMTRPRAQ